MKTIKFDNTQITVYRAGKTPRIRKSGRTEDDPNTFKGVHTHFTYEIFFVTEGTLTLVTEDMSQSFQNSVIIIPPHIKHFSMPDSEGSFCLLFTIEGAKLPRGIVDVAMTEEIAFYIKRLTEKIDIDTPSAEHDCGHLSALIFSAVLDKVSKENSTPQKALKSRDHIGTIESFINGNLGKKFTLSDISKKVFLSTKQISRIIKKEYGMTFSELVCAKRMASAQMLLKNTDLKVSEIAAQTFPGSETYFYTLFKKTYGTSPIHYRKEYTPWGRF